MAVKSENIEFLIIYSIWFVQNLYTSSTNGFTHETMVALSSHMHRPPILSLNGAKMRFGVSSEAPKGVQIENIEFIRIYVIWFVQNPYSSRTDGFTHETMVILSSHMHRPRI